MGIIEEKWEALFEKYRIREEVDAHGCFSITADQIREFKEPRLMTKFDTRESLPKVFGRLGILPVTRGKYVIGDFRLGVSFAILNYTCLGFIRIHTIFYFNYPNYSGLLIFCCQNVANQSKT